MKKLSMLALLVVGIAAGSFVWADHHEEGHKHSKWFDAESCDICKPWHEDVELMKSTKWETHIIKKGVLMVATVSKDQMGSYSKACKKMDAVLAKISAGQSPKELCGFCTAMGGLMQTGAEMEKINTQTGDITILTSDDAETVKKIHAFAKRTQEETKKMLAAMKQTS